MAGVDNRHQGPHRPHPSHTHRAMSSHRRTWHIALTSNIGEIRMTTSGPGGCLLPVPATVRRPVGPYALVMTNPGWGRPYGKAGTFAPGGGGAA
jgi:hypothetical protein